MIPRIYNGKGSALLSALTFNDAAFWGADAFVGVVFALYITNNISGGTAIDVGLVFGLYRIVRAFAAIPIGKFLDGRRGYTDEFIALLMAGLLVGATYTALFFATAMWQVYLGMVMIGIGHSFDVSAWKVLFYGNLPDHKEGQVIGVYTTVMQIVYGLSTVIAGFVGDIFGFQWILLFAGLITLTGTAILLFAKGAATEAH